MFWSAEILCFFSLTNISVCWAEPHRSSSSRVNRTFALTLGPSAAGSWLVHPVPHVDGAVRGCGQKRLRPLGVPDMGGGEDGDAAGRLRWNGVAAVLEQRLNLLQLRPPAWGVVDLNRSAETCTRETHRLFCTGKSQFRGTRVSSKKLSESSNHRAEDRINKVFMWITQVSMGKRALLSLLRRICCISTGMIGVVLLTLIKVSSYLKWSVKAKMKDVCADRPGEQHVSCVSPILFCAVQMMMI